LADEKSGLELMAIFTAIGTAIFGAAFTGFFATPMAGEAHVEFEPSHKAKDPIDDRDQRLRGAKCCSFIHGRRRNGRGWQ
jgi:hypothetical protein